MRTIFPTTPLFFLPFLALILLFAGCELEPSSLSATATVVDSGPVEVDGCGWLVELQGELYFPQDPLPAKFLEHGRQVQLQYTMTEFRRACGFGQQLVPEIYIYRIND